MTMIRGGGCVRQLHNIITYTRGARLRPSSANRISSWSPSPPATTHRLAVELARAARSARVTCDARASDYRIAAWLAGTVDDPVGGKFGRGGWKNDTWRGSAAAETPFSRPVRFTRMHNLARARDSVYIYIYVNINTRAQYNSCKRNRDRTKTTQNYVKS